MWIAEQQERGLADGYVENVSDIVNSGDKVKVKVLELLDEPGVILGP